MVAEVSDLPGGHSPGLTVGGPRFHLEPIENPGTVTSVGDMETDLTGVVFDDVDDKLSPKGPMDPERGVGFSPLQLVFQRLVPRYCHSAISGIKEPHNRRASPGSSRVLTGHFHRLILGLVR